jgi:hypothetical protein
MQLLYKTSPPWLAIKHLIVSDFDSLNRKNNKIQQDWIERVLPKKKRKYDRLNIDTPAAIANNIPIRYQANKCAEADESDGQCQL